MAKKLQGITIEIDGNTTGLSNALKDVNNVISKTNGELKNIDKLLKFDPGNTELLAQKQNVLSIAIKETVDKLDKLKIAKEQADEKIASGKEDKNSAAYRELEREIITTEQNLQKLTKQSDETEKAMNGNAKEIKNFSDAEEKAGQSTLKLGDLIKANLISDAIKKGISNLASEMKKVGNMLLDVGKNAIDSYADYEQLIGGVETLFKDSAGVVEGYANNAYKTAGLSANEYMETVTSFSASLLQSLGNDTEASAKYADQAIIDMADNANKMGTSMSMIQSAYQGFAKQNYTMLDNLKLGYGGTKTEMQRLIADANKVKQANGEMADLSIDSFADITEAIHIIQTEMGITGTTAKEASTTISGSLNSMKSAWSNLLTGVADDNANFEELVNNLVDSIVGENGEGGVLNNLIPRIEIVLDGIVNLILELSNKLLPKILELGTNLIQNLLNGISSNVDGLMSTINQVINTLLNTFVQMLPQLLETGIQVIISLINGIAQSLPDLIPTIVDAVILMVETILDNMDQIIDAGIAIIFGLIDGIIEALPKLIDKMPEIIDKLITAITNNLPKIIEMGIKLIIKLTEGLIKAIPQMVSKIPEIITSLVNGLANGISNIKDVGKRLIEGLWNGIKEKWDGLKKKVEEFGNGIVNKFKSVFGIKSPSRVMRDEVGKYLAEGIGVGVEEEVPKVIKDVNNAMNTLTRGIQASVNPVINPTANSNPLILQIENFNNTRDTDVQALAEELEFYRRNTALAKGGN